MSILLAYTLPIAVAPTPTTDDPRPDGSLTRVVSHCDEGRALLVSQYQDKPRLAALLCAVLDAVQVVDDAAFDVYSELWDLEAAEGVQLEVLGRIVGEERRGKTDDRYRDALRVRILVSRSSGRMDELIEIVRRIDRYADEPTATVVVTEHYPAALVVEGRRTLVNDPAEIARFLRAARAGGVRLDYVYQVGAPGTAFRWALTGSETSATSSTTEGWGSTTDTIGGQWAGMVRA